MKKVLAFLCVMTMVLTIAGTANAILFDFDALSPGATEADVSTYMTDIMNSHGVTGTVVAIATEVSNGPAPLGTDSFIKNMTTYNEHQFGFYFEHPLLAVSFDCEWYLIRSFSQRME